MSTSTATPTTFTGARAVMRVGNGRCPSVRWRRNAIRKLHNAAAPAKVGGINDAGSFAPCQSLIVNSTPLTRNVNDVRVQARIVRSAAKLLGRGTPDRVNPRPP